MTGRPYIECADALAKANKKAGRGYDAWNGLLPKVWEPVFREFGLTRVRMPERRQPTVDEVWDALRIPFVSRSQRHVTAVRRGAVWDTQDPRSRRCRSAWVLRADLERRFDGLAVDGTERLGLAA